MLYRLLFIKIYSSVDRVDGEKCPGYRCPSLTITRTGGSDDLVDCYNDAYDGTYNIAEDVSFTALEKAKKYFTFKEEVFLY